MGEVWRRGSPGPSDFRLVLTAFGAAAVTFMMLMYALERRDRRFILAFAFGCLLSSAYGFLAGTWPFGVVELIWAGIAAQRFVATRDQPAVRTRTLFRDAKR